VKGHPQGRVEDPSPPPLEHRLAPVINTDRAPLRAVHHERREQIGELGVPAVLPRQPLDVALRGPGDDGGQGGLREGGETSLHPEAGMKARTPPSYVIWNGKRVATQQTMRAGGERG
jgi:hypothetical protein